MLLALSSIFGFIAATFAIIGTFWALRFASISKDGILKYAFYAILLSNGLSIFLSPRDFSESGEYFSTTNDSLITIWAIRLTSILLMLAALERIFYFFRQNAIVPARVFLALIILYAWITNLLIPNYITANLNFQISHIYSLIFGIGIALSLQKSKNDLMLHTRNALILFVILSLISTLIKPNHALDLSYSQGYIPGLPRLFGLAPHATLMGLFSALAFWLLIVYPLRNRRNNLILLIVISISLILSQSKTILIIFFFGLLIFYFYSESTTTKTSKENSTKLIIISISLILISVFTASLLLIDIKTWIYQNISANKIYNLTTLTGRDIIWKVALEEFYKSPIFGYGGELFSPQYRAEIGLIQATHGHNQFIDSIARSGIIGLSGYIILYSFLAYYSFKFAKVTKGLSLNLFLLIAIYSITAIPITWGVLGSQTIAFFLLLMLISSHLVKPKEKAI